MKIIQFYRKICWNVSLWKILFKTRVSHKHIVSTGFSVKVHFISHWIKFPNGNTDIKVSNIVFSVETCFIKKYASIKRNFAERTYDVWVLTKLLEILDSGIKSVVILHVYEVREYFPFKFLTNRFRKAEYGSVSFI